MRCGSCPQGGYSLAGKIAAKSLVGRKVHDNYQKRSTEFLGVQRQMGGISTEKDEQNSLEREGNHGTSSYYFYPTLHKMLSHNFSLSP